MKLWEVIKALTEDPTKKFEARMKRDGWVARMCVDNGCPRYFKFGVFDGERLIDQSLDSGAFNDNVALGLVWHEVKQTVTWQEAIQARADGKRVWCEFNNQSWGVPELVVNHLYFKKALDAGKWYVED